MANESHLIPSGVNDTVFRPDGDRGPRDDRFRVGWCANIKGIHTVKGHDEVLRPMMEARPDWDWSVNTRNHENPVSREVMGAWYRSLDAFVCTSVNEGTPSPVFEAAASGVPIVSTDVGMVTDWRMPHDLGLIAAAYSNKAEAARAASLLISRLDELANRREDAAVYGRELRQSIKAHYGYRVIAPQYFQAILGDL